MSPTVRNFTDPRARHAFGCWRLFLVLSSLTLPLIGCGSSSSAPRAALVGVEFPDPLNVNTEPEDRAPQDCPLIQEIVLHFQQSGTAIADLTRMTVRDPLGVQVPGSFEQEENRLRFRPTLPRSETLDLGAGQAPGLMPATKYTLRVSGLRGFSLASSIPDEFRDPVGSQTVRVTFRTTSDPEAYWLGIEPRRPRLLATRPEDGETGISPFLYTDPNGLFSTPEPFRLRFDAPIHPSVIDESSFQLIDLDHRTASFPSGIPLGVEVWIDRNEVGAAEVLLRPTGILPLGHHLSLEYPSALRGLSQQTAPLIESRVAATFTVATASDEPVGDLIQDDFDGAAQLDLSLTTAEHHPGYVQAGTPTAGDGALGDFVPIATSTETVIVLDTSSQTFPLLNGATPDAPRVTIRGGVFSFREIRIPAGVVIEARGPNPLVLQASGSVAIEGEIRLPGRPGIRESAFDSSAASLAGGLPGSGGGRGGEGHPLRFRGDVVSVMNVISPPFGGRGWGPSNAERIGGCGGESGMRDRPDSNGLYGTDFEMDTSVDNRNWDPPRTPLPCQELTDFHNKNGYKPPGGGGGSFLTTGTTASLNGEPLHGVGNVLADGQGGYLVRTPETHGESYLVLLAGAPGASPFQDANPDNDFVSWRHELPTLIGGQGGGAGGSALDSYYCGLWCKTTPHPDLCVAEFGDPPRAADSVGDGRGGPGGGGGGALSIRSLGPISIAPSATLDVRGGDGVGGEALGCSNWTGAGGGGSGGALVLSSASQIHIHSGATLDAEGGVGGFAGSRQYLPARPCKRLRDFRNGAWDAEQVGAGGNGGKGIIQLQVPVGDVATVDPAAVITPGAWVDPQNDKNPADSSSVTHVVSQWWDLGRTIGRPPLGTNPVFSFPGTSPQTGVVLTDSHGSVLDSSSIRVSFLGVRDPVNQTRFLPGQEPRSNYLPPGTRVVVEFQAADAVAEGSKEVDPGSLTEWRPQPPSGKQFLRYRIVFDIATKNQTVTSLSPRPIVDSLSVFLEF